MKNQPNYTKAFIVLTSLFFMWGLITVLIDSLVPRLKGVFELSSFQGGLILFAFFAAYGILSIPSGFVLSKIGYKKGIILGLTIMGIGCLLFYPAASTRTFALFLLGSFTLAGGITVLQVAANPYVAVLGDPKMASSRLNLSQAFNSLGTVIAPIIGAKFLLSDSIKTKEELEVMDSAVKQAYYASEAAAVQYPFLIFATLLLLIALIIAGIKLPNISQQQDGESGVKAYMEALKSKVLVMGMIAIFVYVGAEVSIGSFAVDYFKSMQLDVVIKESPILSSIAKMILHKDLDNVDAKGIVAAFVVFYWTGAMVGRFVGAFLTKVISPYKVLATFSALALTMLLISINTNGVISMVSILTVGFFNSIMFPTIFTLSLSGVEKYKPQASGALCTAIVGGAFIPPLYGLFADSYGFKIALLLLVLCYGYIFFFSQRTKTVKMS